MDLNHEINKLLLDKSQCDRKIKEAIKDQNKCRPGSCEWLQCDENINRLKEESKQIKSLIITRLELDIFGNVLFLSFHQKQFHTIYHKFCSLQQN